MSLTTKPMPVATDTAAPRLTVPILDVHQWTCAFDRITLTARFRDGVAYLAYNGWSIDQGLSLIEDHTTQRLRILLPGVRDGWIEVALSDFHHLLELARRFYGPTYDIFTAIAIS
jgi:hypothetical protein